MDGLRVARAVPSRLINCSEPVNSLRNLEPGAELDREMFVFSADTPPKLEPESYHPAPIGLHPERSHRCGGDARGALEKCLIG